MLVNELYLAVLPIIHISTDVPYMGFGLTEQVLTLFPSKDFATAFTQGEVDTYIATFQNRLHYITGGSVEGYRIEKENTPDGRVIVRVIQRVR